MRWIVRQIIALIQSAPRPAVSDTEIEEFLAHPCWALVQQDAALRMDYFLNVLTAPQATKEDLMHARAGINSLMWLIDIEAVFENQTPMTLQQAKERTKVIQELTRILKKENEDAEQ